LKEEIAIFQVQRNNKLLNEKIPIYGDYFCHLFYIHFAITREESLRKDAWRNRKNQ
jgi:hypothetical protein